MAVQLSRPGEGETITDRPGRFLAIRVASEGLIATESLHGAGELGAPPHVHRAHTDCFYVVSGALRLGIGDGERRLAAGGLVAIPPGVVHAFDNGFDGETHFLNVHAPNPRFAEYLRAMGSPGSAEERREIAARSDSFDPPAGGGGDPEDVRISDSGEQLHTADLTAGVVALAAARDADLPAGPTALRVLNGELELIEDGASTTLGAGTWALVEPGTAASVRNASGAPARYLQATGTP